MKKNTKGLTVILICFISVTFLRMKSIFCLKFTNRWFSVVTRNIMPFDTIGIEIVENANTNFVAISIVRLRFSFANLFCAVRIFFLSAIKNVFLKPLRSGFSNCKLGCKNIWEVMIKIWGKFSKKYILRILAFEEILATIST